MKARLVDCVLTSTVSWSLRPAALYPLDALAKNTNSGTGCKRAARKLPKPGKFTQLMHRDHQLTQDSLSDSCSHARQVHIRAHLHRMPLEVSPGHNTKPEAGIGKARYRSI